MKNLSPQQKKIVAIKEQQNKGINTNGASTNPFGRANPFSSKKQNPFLRKPRFTL